VKGPARTGERRRALLGEARLLLVFTPEASGTNDPLAALERALDAVDAVEVRPKPAGDARAPTSAREAFDWTLRVLDLCGERELLVLVNDRVDVARALAERGCDGVHLGQADAPPAVARELLGPELLIGLSTHDAAQVVLATEAPVDYLGFGPVFPTATKGYGRGLGPERAWIAAEASALPVFPIGGIDLANAESLERIGRAAVSSAVLSAPDPLAAARALRELLTA
jgi:thiamine-phosphate pyrophosphorylase